MKLCAIMPVRNEAYCLGLTARAALMWCDELVVMDHASSDDSVRSLYEIAQDVGPDRVVWRRDMNSVWREMEHRQILLDLARERGATHIAIVDADEILTGNLLPDDSRNKWPWYPRVSTGHILQLPGYNLRGSLDRYHASGIWGSRWFSTVFRDDPRLHWGGDKFHSREPEGIKLLPYLPIKQGEGGVMHLWGCDERRLRAKSALYKITERLRWPDKPVAEIDRMYSWAIHGRPEAGDTPEKWTFKEAPASWWEPYLPLMKYLDVSAEPWQVAECKRLIAEHGAAKFVGLELFGVPEW